MSAQRKRKPESISEQAYTTIKDMIIRGELEQGAVVSVLLLSEQLGIGRTPVTIACQRLEYDGLVRIIPKQGVLIRPLTIDEVREVYESRLAIELFMAEKAFDFINPADIKALQASLKKQEQIAEKKDAYAFMEEDTYFHRYILNKYSNQTLMGMHHNLTDRIFLVGVRNSSNHTRLLQTIDGHHDIVRALIDKDKATFMKEIEYNIISGYISMTSLYYNV